MTEHNDWLQLGCEIQFSYEIRLQMANPQLVEFAPTETIHLCAVYLFRNL
ncbi:hypothetical protein VCR14J2_410340 [Vibrio coralliirubri]|nr:hypothetical protein VCR14J2_410340 [Vibrio coralliirubri]